MSLSSFSVCSSEQQGKEGEQRVGSGALPELDSATLQIFLLMLEKLFIKIVIGGVDRKMCLEAVKISPSLKET